MTWFGICIFGLLIAGGLFLSGFFSGAETGLYHINRLRLHLDSKRSDPRALKLSQVLSDEQGALSVTLIGTNLANYVTTAAVAYLFAEQMGLGETDSELYTVMILTPIVFVFGEVVPKNLFRLHADRLMARSAGLLGLADRLFRLTGLVWCLDKLAGLINRRGAADPPGGGASTPKRRVAMLLQEALAGNPLGEDQSDLIERVCGLSEQRLHSVMVPRNRVVAISAKTDRRSLSRVARRTPHARLPVHDRNPRHITGIVKVDELLRRDDWEHAGELLAPAITLSPHTTVAAAMTHLQHANQEMAIVANQGGQMLGIVTLKDLLAQVVGEVTIGV